MMYVEREIVPRFLFFLHFSLDHQECVIHFSNTYIPTIKFIIFSSFYAFDFFLLLSIFSINLVHLLVLRSTYC